MLRLGFALIVGLGLACAQSNGDGIEGAGEAGSAGSGAGGSGGTGGRGGTGADGGGAGHGGTGATGGNASLDWIDADASWRELPEVSSEEAQIRVREAVPDALTRLTLPSWTECGPGCEWLDLGAIEPWNPAMDTADVSEGPRVFVSFIQPRPGYLFRRYVDLRSGASIGALRFDATVANQEYPPYGPAIGNSAFMTTLFSNDRMLHTLYDHRAGRWEFKLPWSEINDPVCERWMLDSSPPVLFYGCGPVLKVSGAGSNVRTLIEESGNYGSGAGNAELSVWSELSRERPTSSRLRTWTPDSGTGVLVDALPGIACALAVSPTQVAGLRSGDPNQVTNCPHPLREPTFWSVSREDGTILSWPVPGVEPMSPARTSTWGNHAAAMVLTSDVSLSNGDRSSLWLLRFSDGKLRRLIPSPDQEWSGALLALDDTHLYIGENAEGAIGSTLSRIFRYRLDHFDQIGTPLE